MSTTQSSEYGVKEIADLFPPLMEIKDEALREKVAAVWNEAIAINNGVPQGLTSAIFANDVREAEKFLSPAGSDCGITNDAS